MILLGENKKYTSTKKNDADYALEVCKAMMARPCSIGGSAKQEAERNFLYAKARQDVAILKNSLTTSLGKKNISKLFSSDDLDITPLGISKLVYNAIYARVASINMFKNIELVDEKTSEENLKHISELLAAIQMQEPMKKIFGENIMLPQIESMTKDSIMTPTTIEELQTYKEMGYKNVVEVLLEKHLKIIDNANDHDFEIMPVINEWLICAGIACVHQYFDIDNAIREEAIPINSISVIGGNKRNYEDAIGYVIEKKYNIDTFCDMAGIDSDDDYRQLLSSASDIGNIDIKLCYWSSYNDYSLKICIDDNNNIFIRPHEGKSHIRNRVQKWYRAYYVPSIDKVYMYGEVPIQYRKKHKGKFYDAYSPITIIRGTDKDICKNGIISNIRQFEDMANLLLLKLKNEIALIKPTRMRIDMKQLIETAETMKIIEPNIKADDLLNALNKGLALEVSATIDNEGTRGGNYSIEPYPMTSLSGYMALINNFVELAFVFSGIPRIDAGLEAIPNTSNMQSKIALQGANKNMTAIMDIKRAIIKTTAEKKINAVIMLYTVRNNPYKEMFDDYEVQMLEDIDFLISRETVLTVDDGYSEQDIQEFKMLLAQQNNRHRETQGAEGISLDDNLNIMQWLKEHPKVARYRIAMLLEKKKREKREREEAAMQQNMMSQMLSNQAANSMKAQTEQIKLQGKEIEGQNAIALEDRKAQNRAIQDTLQDRRSMIGI